MNGDVDDVWPPQPVRQNNVEPPGRSECCRAVSTFGTVSLALTLPGLLLFALDLLNERVMHWTAIFAAIKVLGYLATALVFLLPALGFCVGIAGWRSQAGKLGVGAAVFHYGFIFAVALWIGP